MTGSFLAIDFECPSAKPHHAWSVGMVAVFPESGHTYRFSSEYRAEIDGDRGRWWRGLMHGIESMGIYWAETVVAHNAPFDRTVMAAMCDLANVADPLAGKEWICTLELAREYWPGDPCGLAQVCRELAIPLKHHDPLSDALAAAGIYTRLAI